MKFENKINIGDKTYYVEYAKTPQEKSKGLKDIKSLEKDKGMLFFLGEPQDTSFWMKDTHIPLDIIFIDEYYEVISVKEGTPLSEDPIKESNVKFVLEVNINSEILPGDDLEIVDEEEEGKLPKMKILAPDGTTQMELEGGERIFSRVSTRVLIRKSKKANRTKEDKDYAALGRYLFKEINNQDNREPQYV